MMKKKKLLYESRGGLNLGYVDLKGHFFVSWPFGKIECYNNKLIIKIEGFDRFNPSTFKMKRYDMGALGRVPKNITLKYKDIKGYKKKKIYILEWIMGKSIQIFHKNKKYPEGIKLWLYGRSFKEVINILNAQGKKEII